MSFIQAQRWYIIAWLILFVPTLLLFLFTDKPDALLWINARHTALGDQLFAYITRLGEAFSYVLAFVVLVAIDYKRTIAVPFIAFMATIASAGLKGYFKQPRPFYYFQQHNQLEQLNFVEGVELITASDTSFPSGHTISAFALFGFLALISKRNTLKVTFLLIAALIGISRIYLVQHFLPDVLAGAVTGTAIALLTYWLSNRFSSILEQRKKIA